MNNWSCNRTFFLENIFFKKGKRSVSAKLKKKIFIFIKNEYKVNPKKTFLIALKNATPLIIQSKQIHIKNNFTLVTSLVFRQKIGFRWIVKEALSNQKKLPFFIKLSHVVYETALNKGGVIKIKKNYYQKFIL